MTRCLNCGAERTADVCAACGLSTVAAEFSLRRKLLARTAIFLVGSLAFLAAGSQYPALELDGMLIFIGVIFFVALTLAIGVERRALRHTEVEALKRIYYGLIPLPWLLAGLLFVNGALDRSPPLLYPTRVVGKFSMPGLLGSRRLVVTSWRGANRFERIAISRSDFDRFRRGDLVIVDVRSGLAGIPWVAGVSHR